MKSILGGLVAAPFTPFHPDGELNLAAVPRQAALLEHNGVQGAFVCGTTGEGCSLTVAERRATTEAWRGALKTPKVRLVVHVGHLSLQDSRGLAAHAQEIGADAIATIAPSFFKPPGVAELVGWCREVAAAAPALPFYYYHMPAMTGVNIPVADFLQQAADQIPTLAGIKFTHEDLMDYGRSGQVGDGRFAMLFGRDEILLAGLCLGAKGAVGSTYNYAAPLYHRIIAAFERGDLGAARVGQTRAQAFIAILNRHGGLVAGKAAMKFVGIDCGGVRLPLRPLSPANEQHLRRDLESVGFFEYCSRMP